MSDERRWTVLELIRCLVIEKTGITQPSGCSRYGKFVPLLCVRILEIGDQRVHRLYRVDSAAAKNGRKERVAHPVIRRHERGSPCDGYCWSHCLWA